jgi:hypothetical protein
MKIKYTMKNYFKGGVHMPYGYGGYGAGTGTVAGAGAGFDGFGGGFLNPYTMIIVILIVLQWFRVGNGVYSGAGVAGAVTPEPGLLNNGGLFIIAIFLLVFCGCGRSGGAY